MKQKTILQLTTALFVTLFTACGGGGGGESTPTTSTTQSAYLIDSAVSGVSYTTNSRSGMTDTRGKISFNPSDTSVSFKIGGVILGDFNLSRLPSDRKIYVSELLGLTRDVSNDTQLIKLLQFLQSLDSDNNPLNGITIESAVATALDNSNLDFRDNSLDIDDINATIRALSKSLISKEEAVTYFEKSLQEIGYTNDTYPPVFLSADEVHVRENTISSFLVRTLDVSEVTYALGGSDAADFTIDEESGRITFKTAPDYETKERYDIRVEATDANNQSSTQDITVVIDDLFEATVNVPTLVVVMNWNDYAEDDAADWYDKFFNINADSVNRWFFETMGGAISITPVDETSGTHDDGIIMVDMGKDHPGGNDNTEFRDTEIVNAITSDEVVDNVDFAALDTNGDGILNQKELQIIFIVSGGEMSFGDPIDHSIWAHSWSFASNAGPEVDGVHVMQHSSDLEKAGSYARFGANHNDHQATIGVIVHEMGHSLLDLEDYYDDGDGSGLGWYDVMSGGSWARKEGDNYAGQTPTQYSAYNRIDTGFDMNVTDVANTQTLTIGCSSKDILKLVTSKDSEYFLVACRDTAKANSDISMNYADNNFTENRLFMSVYHVDDEKDGNTEDGDQNTTHHYKVAFLEKDTSTLMTSTEHEHADFSDVYIVGDSIDRDKILFYDDTQTGFSIDVESEDTAARTMTIKITKN